MKRFALAAAAIAWLVSCGGGGGGGSNSPGGSSSFSVSYNRNSLSFEGFEGTQAVPQTIVGTGAGDPGGTVYALVLIEGQGVAPSGVSLSFSGAQVTISVTPRTDLAPGSYTGRLILQACADPQCNRHFSGSPFAVSYTSVVRARLRVNPSPISLTAASGESRTTRIAVTPTDGAGSYSAVVTQGGEWLRIENQNPTGFDLVTQPLPGGNYSGTVQLSSGAFNQTLPVPLTVTPAAGGDADIALSTTALTINAAATASAQETVSVTPPTWSAQLLSSVDYQSGNGWLTATRGAGTTWTISANAATLNPGTYAARVIFQSTYPSQPRILNVTLVVGAGLVLPAQQSLTVNAETQAAALSGSVPVSVAGGIPFTWTATTASPWLRLSATTGTSSTPINWTIDQAALAGLPNFSDHTATIDVTTNLPNVSGGQMQIALSRQLPEVHQVTPYLLVQGRSERVIIRGRGFNSMLNPAARLALSGVTPTSVTRISDQQLVVQLPSISASTVQAQATNRLGIATTVLTLKTVAGTSRPYAFVPGAAGFTKSLLHDGERDALFATQYSAGTNSVTRLVRSGATWTTSPLIAADTYDVALAPDGSALIAANTAGELRWLNPVTGTENTAARLVLSGRRLTDDREYFLAQGLTVTADGLVWLAAEETAGSPFKVLTPVNLRTRQVGAPSTSQTSNFLFYRGPLFTTPRDGSRMLGRQNSGLSGVDDIYDAIRYDTATSGFGRSTKLRSPFDMRFTHDGRLVLVNLDRVIDANDDLHGLLRLPTSQGLPGADYQVVAGQINGNGTRVYLLVYPYRDQFGYSSASSGIKPRLFVFDSSTASASTSGLPLLGYVELNDFPSDCLGFDRSCWYGLASTLSADGNTLFFLGSRGLVVMPVPTALLPLAAPPTSPALWLQ